jgi:phosphoserine phosphatase RsbU/P
VRVLVADDDVVTGRVLGALLTSWGHEVISVADGATAFDRLQADNPPGLALIDWMMPGRDGPDVCRSLRARQTSTPTYVILLTSRNAGADVVAGLESGADDYLVKPFNPDELRARLNAGIRIVKLQRSLAAHVSDLEGALAKVRRLSGLLPICSYCKSIRDDSDYWRRVDEYIGEHMDVTFTHGICPSCRQTLEQQLFGDSTES